MNKKLHKIYVRLKKLSKKRQKQKYHADCEMVKK